MIFWGVLFFLTGMASMILLYQYFTGSINAMFDDEEPSQSLDLLAEANARYERFLRENAMPRRECTADVCYSDSPECPRH